MNETTTPTPEKAPKHAPSLSEKIGRINAAWTALAHGVVYGDMTQAQYSAAVAPYIEADTAVSAFKLAGAATVVEKKLADKDSLRQLNAVVAGIKADPNFGPDSGLYRACGYTPSSERATRRPSIPGAPTHKSNPMPMYKRLALVIDAWEAIGVEAKFANMTIAEFKTATAESRATRARLATLNAYRNTAVSDRNAARGAVRRTIQKVIAGVVITDGKASPIYHAMGYKHIG